MRVLLACVYGSSGIDTYTRLLASGLSGAGHDVLLVDRSRGSAESMPGVERVRLRPLRHRVRRVVGAFEALPIERQVREVALEREVDVVHATLPSLAPRSWPSLVVSAWDPEPRVLARARQARSRGQRAWQEALYAVSDAIGCGRAAAVAAVTPAVREALRPRFPLVVWLPPFVPDAAIEARSGERGDSCVMVANYLDHPRKNLGLAVEVVRRVRVARAGVRLVLVGGWLGDPGVLGLPDFCEVRGRLAPSEVARLLREAGCCLLPSTWEEFGYAGLEALAAGTPLACGPLPAFAGLSSGVFVSPSLDPAPFADAVHRALASTTFEFPLECRASTAIPAHLALYERVADTRPRTG